MAAKNKTNSRTSPSLSREDADLRDLLGLHFQASRRVEEVLEQVQELRAAGKLPEARAMQMHADGIQHGIRALEQEIRLTTRASRQQSSAADRQPVPMDHRHATSAMMDVGAPIMANRHR